MRKIILLLALIIGGLALKPANSQNVNISMQPQWGPVGYDYVEYYYLPDIQVYYNVPTHKYIYMNNGKWVFVNSLPSRYNVYNFNQGYKVVINEPKAYLKFKTHKVNYGKYKGHYGKQGTIKYSKDPKYMGSKQQPQNKGNGVKSNVPSQNNGKGQVQNKGQGHDQGKGKGQGTGKVQGQGQGHDQGKGQGPGKGQGNGQGKGQGKGNH